MPGSFLTYIFGQNPSDSKSNPVLFKIEALIQVSFWKGSQILALQLKGWFNSIRQSKNIEMKYETYIEFVHELSMVHVSNPMWRVKNQPSNSTSCSDNALHLWVLVAGRLYWGLQVTSYIFNLVCDLKGCFERGIFEGPNRIWRALKASILNTDPIGHMLTSFGFALHIWGVFSTIESSKMIGNPHEISNFNRLSLNLNRFICN